MHTRELLKDAFSRIQQVAQAAAEELSAQDLWWRPDPGANSIAWLIWHLTRIQDDHVSELADRPQAWVAEGWAERFGQPPDPSDTGHGHTAEQVARIRPENAELLLAYHNEVIERTVAYLATLEADELDRIIDRSYEPPVTVGVRLVSVLSDNLQHAGQARYLRGMLQRQEGKANDDH